MNKGLFALSIISALLISNHVKCQVWDKFQLTCTRDYIQVDITMKSEFNGVIYTRGSFKKNHCSVDAQKEFSLQLKFPLTECMTTKVNDTMYNNILIVQHNDNFVSKGDLSLNLICSFGSPDQYSVNVTEPLTFEMSDLEETVTDYTVAAAVGKQNLKTGSLLLVNKDESNVRKAKTNSSGSSIARPAG